MRKPHLFLGLMSLKNGLPYVSTQSLPVSGSFMNPSPKKPLHGPHEILGSVLASAASGKCVILVSLGGMSNGSPE